MTLTPIRREVLVDAAPALAFRVFTERIDAWWPLADFSVHGAGGTVAFVDGAIVESAAGHDDCVWGRVTNWDPPSALAFTWHPGQPAERASRVAVTFVATGGQTLVRLEHSGWEVYSDPAATRAEYDHGWPIVLAGFRSAAAGSEVRSAAQ